MNTNLKNTVFGAVIVAAALLASVGSANAGGQTHRMPADYGKTYPTYELKVVGVPAADAPFTVQLVNDATGELVANAHVTMQHSIWLGMKAAPQVQRVQVALEPNGRGNYVCASGHLLGGEKIVLRAHVPGESSATWLTVASNN
jgi:hypothetical protein